MSEHTRKLTTNARDLGLMAQLVKEHCSAADIAAIAEASTAARLASFTRALNTTRPEGALAGPELAQWLARCARLALTSAEQGAS